jgi:hypothetical protein
MISGITWGLMMRPTRVTLSSRPLCTHRHPTVNHLLSRYLQKHLIITKIVVNLIIVLMSFKGIKLW